MSSSECTAVKTFFENLIYILFTLSYDCSQSSLRAVKKPFRIIVAGREKSLAFLNTILMEKLIIVKGILSSLITCKKRKKVSLYQDFKLRAVS